MFRALSFAVLFSIIVISSVLNQEGKKNIIFFGDSITAGYGIPIEQAFTSLIQERIDKSDLNYRVINAGLSGETSAGGLNRIDWILRSKPQIFFLELGGNDGLRGLSLKETEDNLKVMINKIRTANAKADIFLCGMQIPPNLGQDYTSQFKTLYADVAKEMNVKLIPFLLEGVGGDPKLNLSDGIHPNPKGHAIVAETVWSFLELVL